jgi:hypothetical protein
MGGRNEVPVAGICDGGLCTCIGLHLLLEHNKGGSTAAATRRRDSRAARIGGRYDYAYDDHNDHGPLAGGRIYPKIRRT